MGLLYLINVLLTRASIGKLCNKFSTIIEHDVKISNHCNISTSITINGNVEVGENSFIGSGSVIIQSTKVKKFINTNV